jgi:Kdo2-lipid IVA lauroyltransferase/acyltransferase
MRWLFAPVKLFAWFVYRLPWRAQRAFAALLAILWFDVLRIRRRVVVDNLGKAFPALARAERVRLGRKAMIEFCANVVQYSYLPFLDNSALAGFFTFEGRENIERVQARGKGVLMLTLHLGNGDLAMAGLGLIGLPINMISKVMKAKWLNDMWFGLREKFGVKFIAPRNSSFAVLKALKRNEVVIFVQDQFTGPPIGVKTTFFGHETGTGLGLATMAERSGAGVVPTYNLRRPDGTIHIVFGPEIPFEAMGDQDETLRHMTQVYNDRLEQYVKMCPEQWMWLHKRWKKFKY